MKQPAPSVMVSLVGDRHTVKLDSLERRPGLKALRSMRKRSFRGRREGGKDKEANVNEKKQKNCDKWCSQPPSSKHAQTNAHRVLC